MLQRHPSTLNPAISSLAAFTPIGDRVLLRRHKDTEKLSHGIILPQTSTRVDLAHFEVVATGPRCTSVCPGDTALAPRQMTYQKVELDSELLEIAPEHTLSAVIPKSE